MNRQKLLVVLILLPIVASLFFSAGSVSAYDLELDGYAHYKVVAYEAGVGAGTDYQVVIVVHYGTGTDGTMTLNGETVALLHVGDIQADFDDVRFANQFGELLTFKRCSYVSAVNATFVVKVEANLDVDQLVYVYFGNLAAVDASSDNALVDVITGVVGAWRMNDATGASVTDYSGNNNTGTPINNPSQIVGKFGYGLQFTGASDTAVTVPDSALWDFAGAFSVSAWFKSNVNGDGLGALIMHDTSAYKYIMLLNVDKPKMYVVTASGTSTTGDGAVITDNNFHLVTMTYDPALPNSRLKLYVDANVVVASDGLAEALTSGDEGLVIGGTFFGLTGGITGNISDVVMYNVALSDAQRLNLYANYPDVTLEAGKVYVRKWATTTLPAVAGVSDVVDNVAFSPVVDGALTDTEWFISGLLLVLALANVVLLAFPFALLRFVFGVLSFALSAWAFTYSGLPLAPYLQVMGLVSL